MLHFLQADLQNLYWKVFDVLVQEVSQMNQVCDDSPLWTGLKKEGYVASPVV